MKIQGLGDDRRGDLYQIETLVREVDQFSSDIFLKMIDDYKRNDPIVGKILEDSKEIADANYTRYLNRILVGGKMGISALSFDENSNYGSVIGKAMSEMREKIRSESDYCKQFLGPEVARQTQIHEIQLRSAQKEEIKKQREELKALSKIENKGKSFFSFGR